MEKLGKRSREIPEWVKDSLVQQLFSDLGLKIKVVYDDKYVKGLTSKPLIIIKRMNHKYESRLRNDIFK